MVTPIRKNEEEPFIPTWIKVSVVLFFIWLMAIITYVVVRLVS